MSGSPPQPGSADAIPQKHGAWELAGLSGVVGTHASLLHTRKVLFFTRPEDPSHRWQNRVNGLPGDGQRSPTEPDVTLSTAINVSNGPPYTPIAVHVESNPFCAGHVTLADGRLLVAGGDKKDSTFAGTPENTSFGLNVVRTFNPDTANPGNWETIGQISDGRWYPTCTLLPDGRVFIISGSLDDQQNYNNQNPTCEIYPRPSGPRPAPPGDAQYLHFLVEAWPYHSYPFVFVLPSGSLFVFVKDTAYHLDLIQDAFGRERWNVQKGAQLPPERFQRPVSGQRPARHYPNNGTAVLLPLLPNDDPQEAYAAEVLVIGGASADVYPHFSGDKIPEVNTHTHFVDALCSCYRLRVPSTGTGGTWQPTELMKKARVMPDAVLLPDGTVLVLNGASKGFAGGNAATGPVMPEHAVKEAELYNPMTGEWHLLGKANCPRLYHSTALLLPDARVLVAGSDHQANADRPIRVADGDERNRILAEGYEYQMEVFSPPYMFTGAPRPSIDPVEDQKRIAYGQRFEIRVNDLDGFDLKNLRVSLLRPGSVTHNNNMSQRHVGLKVLSKSATHLALEAPPNPNIAPPGHYMLFVLHAGVPSEAIFVKLPQEPAQKPPVMGGTAVASDEPGGIPPAEPGGMALWLRADTGVEVDEEGWVTAWSDRSGHGNDLFWRRNVARNLKKPIQRPPTLIPHELRGHPVVRFTIIDYAGTQWGGRLQSDAPFLPGNGPYAVFVVVHPWPSGNGGRENRGIPGVVGWGDFSAPADQNAAVALRLGPGPRSGNPPDAPPGFVNHLPGKPGRASVVTFWGTEGLGDDSQAPVSLEHAVLLETRFEGEPHAPMGIWELCLNGQLLERQIAGKSTGLGPLTIGQNGARGDFFRGDVAEVLIFDRVLKEDERNTIREYLRDRYALW